jgi:hypothetical protein
MQVICSWCENFMREKEPLNDGSKSHGICKGCYQKATDEIQSSASKYRKEKEGILQNKNRGVKTETKRESLSLTGGEFQGSSWDEVEISLSAHTQDNPIIDGGETGAEFRGGEGQREDVKSRGRNRYEEFRSLNVYIKEVTREPLH